MGMNRKKGTGSMSKGTHERAPGTWDADLTHGMIAQVGTVGAAQWVGPETIAYVQDHNGRADIYLTDPAGGLPLLLTVDRPKPPVFTGGFGSGYAVAPGAPEGGRGGTIVYTSPEDGKLYAVAAGGGQARRISEGKGATARRNSRPTGGSSPSSPIAARRPISRSSGAMATSGRAGSAVATR